MKRATIEEECFNGKLQQMYGFCLQEMMSSKNSEKQNKLQPPLDGRDLKALH